MASNYPESTCPRCLKTVLDSEKGIQCESECARWFHASCIPMNDSTYNEYATNNKKIWHCGRVDCSGKNDHLQTMSDQIAEILKHMPNLSTKNEIAGINNGIVEIMNDLKEIHQKLNDFEPRLKVTEDRLDAVEEKLSSMGGDALPKTAPEDIIAELNDRARRTRNVLVYNIPEIKNPNIKARIAHDKTLIVKLIQLVSHEIDSSDIKILRLGKPSKDKPRPIKLIFRDDSEARKFSESFSKDQIATADSSFGDVSISRDRTPRERQYLSDLRVELDTRTRKGEKNLSIKYRNGVPEITCTQPKND